jgi:hypothetical protein
VSCTDADHDLLRADPELFRASTEPRGAMDDGTEFLELANCKACGSTLALCSASRRAA